MQLHPNELGAQRWRTTRTRGFRALPVAFCGLLAFAAAALAADEVLQLAAAHLREALPQRRHADTGARSSWVTQGGKIGQIALFFGANDMGSLMIEENVVASAGTVHYLTLDQIKRSIREAGYVPRQRNVFYNLINA